MFSEIIVFSWSTTGSVQHKTPVRSRVGCVSEAVRIYTSSRNFIAYIVQWKWTSASFNHAWGSVGSQHAAPGERFQIWTHCFGQGYRLKINPNTFAGYGGKRVPRETPLLTNRQNQAKEPQRWDTNPVPSCLATAFTAEPLYGHTVNESAPSGQKWGRREMTRSKSC